MGNTALKGTSANVDRISRVDGRGVWSTRNQEVVTVKNRYGTAMELTRGITVAKFLRDFPGHFVSKVAEVGSVCQANLKKLSSGTRLKRGRTYFVLPRDQLHQKPKRKAGIKSSKVSPTVSPDGPDSEFQDGKPEFEEGEETPRPRTIRVRMTKQQLAQMIADGTIVVTGTQSQAVHDVISGRVKAPELRYSSKRLFNHPTAVENNSASLNKRSWSPELDSIVEVPNQKL